MTDKKPSKDQKISLREIKRRLIEISTGEKFDYVIIKKSPGDYVASESGPRDQYEKEFIATIDKISDSSVSIECISKKSVDDAKYIRDEG